MNKRKLLQKIRISGLLIVAIGILTFIASSRSTGAFIFLLSGSVILIGAFIASIYADTVSARDLLTRADYRLLTIEDLPSLDNTPKPRKTGRSTKKVESGVDAKGSKPKRKYKKRAPRRKKPAVKAA